MQTGKKESELSISIREKEQEKYSFYKLYEITHIVLTLMNAYEGEEYISKGKIEFGQADIEAKSPTEKTKRLKIDTSLINYIDLQLEYDLKEAIQLFGFGPSDSRFKLNISKDDDLDYIQDFADVLYLYRSEHEIKELTFDELDEMLKKYLEISKEEIELRNKFVAIQKVKK